jgi:SynChlorMet cassette protein ScmC
VTVLRWREGGGAAAGTAGADAGMEQAEHGKTYRLTLGVGLVWDIVAEAGATTWTQRFAGILQLPECDAGLQPRLVVTRDPGPADAADAVVRESKHLRFVQHNGSPDTTCLLGAEEDETSEIYKMWELLLPVHEELRRRGGLTFHGALLEKGGAAVILSGVGGTGKSTCARRVAPPWRALCDDECLIARDAAGGYVVHPLPTWSDYLLRRAAPVWEVSRATPLVGIFFLRQAAADMATPLGRGEAVLRVHEAGRQVCQYTRLTGAPPQERQENLRMLENAERLVCSVPAFTLDVSLTGSFWLEIERTLLA